MTTAPTRNRDVLIVADVGRGLLGGEALLTAFRQGLPELSLVAASADPAATAARHGVRAFPWQSWRELTRVLRGCRAVVFAGNQPFDPSGDGRGHRNVQMRRSLALAAYAKATGRSVCMVGVGVSGPYDGTGRAIARGLAKQADLLVLRDDASAHALMGLGLPSPLRVGADAVWTLLDHSAVLDHPDAGGGQHAGRVVVVPPSGRRSADPLTERLAALTSSLPVGALVAAAGDDVVEFARRIGGARLVVSRELHVSAAAAATGTPALSVVTGKPERALADRLGQHWVSPAGSDSDLEAALQRALAAPPPARAVVQGEIAAADETFGLLRLVLSGGAMSAENIAGLRLESAS